MSYSVVSSGASKSEAIDQLLEKLDGVVSGQPIHAVDIESVKAAAATLAEKLRDPVDGETVSASASGSLSCGANNEITAISLNFNARLSR